VATDRPENVGARLKALRLALGFNQARAFAAFLEINEQAWNHFETGRRPPVVRDGIRIAERTGASLDWIYRGLEHTLPLHLAEKLRQVDA
jgi:transcriptional regulator with XRE-family HTH domain